MKLFQENPNPSEEDLCLFSNKIKEVESLGLACEYRNINTGRGGVRSVIETKKEEPVKPPYVHYLYGENHKKGKCDVVCTGCGMLGSHKPKKCWKLHPELKPKNLAQRGYKTAHFVGGWCLYYKNNATQA